MQELSRDDKNILKSVSFFSQLFIGIAFYFPLSSGKKSIFRMLGAKIGKGVYIGPGTVIISKDYSQVIIGNDVFIAPEVMIKVNTISIGDQTHIGYQSLLVGESLSIGKRCNINNRTFIESSFASVEIENDVTIAASVIISSHDGAYKQTRGLDMKAAPIIIKNHSFLGNNAIILPGISIGNRAIVGAGAVVTKDVQDDSIVIGVPATILNKKESKDV